MKVKSYITTTTSTSISKLTKHSLPNFISDHLDCHLDWGHHSVVGGNIVLYLNLHHAIGQSAPCDTKVTM